MTRNSNIVVYVIHDKTRISSTNTMGKKFCGDKFGVDVAEPLLVLPVVLPIPPPPPLCNNCIQARYKVHCVLAPRNGCNRLNNPMGAVGGSFVLEFPVDVVVAASIVAVGFCCIAKKVIISAILSTFSNVTSLCIIQE